MTDISMVVYLKAKRDGNFLDEIASVLEVPDCGSDVLKKASFANAYAAWLIAKGKWEGFATENEIEL